MDQLFKFFIGLTILSVIFLIILPITATIGIIGWLPTLFIAIVVIACIWGDD